MEDLLVLDLGVTGWKNCYWLTCENGWPSPIFAFFSIFQPDNFESHNSLKLSFTNIQGLPSNFVNCESFLESNSPDILALMWEKPVSLNWFWQFLCEKFFLNLKGFYYAYAWFHSLCEGRTSFYTFVFGDFNVNHMDWLTYSGGAGELCYNFSITYQ